MKKKELKKVTKRVMEQLLVEKKNDIAIFDTLSKLSAKMLAEHPDDFAVNDISKITSEDCSKEDLQQINVALVKAIRKEFKKKNSFLLTMRLVIALYDLYVTEEVCSEIKKMGKKEKLCYEFAEHYDLDFEILDMLSLASELDSLIKS